MPLFATYKAQTSCPGGTPDLLPTQQHSFSCRTSTSQTKHNRTSQLPYSLRKTMPTLKVCFAYFRRIARIYLILHNTVYPVHLAFVILNEGAGEENTGKPQQSLFSSVIQKAGGEPVCIRFYYGGNRSLKFCFLIATRPQSSTKADRAFTHSRTRSR